MRGKSTLTATPNTSTARLPRRGRAKVIAGVRPAEPVTHVPLRSTGLALGVTSVTLVTPGVTLVTPGVTPVTPGVTLGVTLRDYADGWREGGGGATRRPGAARSMGRQRGDRRGFSGGVVWTVRLGLQGRTEPRGRSVVCVVGPQ